MRYNVLNNAYMLVYASQRIGVVLAGEPDTMWGAERVKMKFSSEDCRLFDPSHFGSMRLVTHIFYAVCLHSHRWYVVRTRGSVSPVYACGPFALGWTGARRRSDCHLEMVHRAFVTRFLLLQGPFVRSLGGLASSN